VPTLLVDVSNADFLNNPSHLQTIIKALEKKYDAGLHVVSLPD
jgi:hypothetical protein